MISAKQRAQTIKIVGSSNFSSMSSSSSSSCSSESDPIIKIENSSSINTIVAGNLAANANNSVNVNTSCTLNSNSNSNQHSTEQTSTKNAITTSSIPTNNNSSKNCNIWNGNKCKFYESKPELINEVYDYWKNFDIKRLQVSKRNLFFKRTPIILSIS